MLKPMTKEHISAVAEIERLCFSEPWSENALAESLESPLARFFVYEDGEVMGYMGMYTVAGEGSVTNVATHPDHRRKGVALALVENSVKIGKELGLDYITLEVRESNAPAVKLYEKCGFRVMGKRKGFYSSPKEDAIIMNCFFDSKD